MNIQLDFANKVIRLNSTENFCELYKKLKKILPDLKDWKLDSTPITHWYNPIIWDWSRPYYWHNPSPIYLGGTAGYISPSATTSSNAQGFCGNVHDRNDVSQATTPYTPTESIVNLQLN